MDKELLKERFELYSESTQDAIKNLKGYFTILEKLLADAEKQEVSVLKEHSQDLSKDKEEKFWLHNYPIHWEDTFVPNFRYSFLLWSLSVVEFHLNWINEDVSLLVGVSKQYKKIKTEEMSDISKIEKKLLSNKKIKFDNSHQTLWQQIKDTYKIRNIVAHNWGYFFDYSEERENNLRESIKGVGYNFGHFALCRLS